MQTHVLHTVQEVAACLKIKQARTVHGYIKTGALEALRLPCGQYRITQEALETFRKKMTVTPQAKVIAPVSAAKAKKKTVALGSNKLVL